MNRSLRYCILCICMLTMNAYAAEWQTLTGEELAAAFADKTILGKRYAVYYDGKGTMRGVWKVNKKKGTYTGKYFFKDDKLYCSVWDNYAKGEQEGCWTVERKKNKLRIKPASGRASAEQVLKIKNGNVKGI